MNDNLKVKESEDKIEDLCHFNQKLF